MAKNYAELTSEAGPLYLLGFEVEKNCIVAWGHVTDFATPVGTRYLYQNETYQADIPIDAELCLFGIEDDPPYRQLSEPLILRKVASYGR